MGQPKFARKKYETPNHPWQGERIKSEHELRRKFGLKNKTEIWKAQSRLRTIRGQARELVSRTRNPDDAQAQAEAKLLLRRLHREGYVAAEATLNEVLGLDLERILNRRLQSQVYLKGMARTPKQARQFVSHGLVVIGQRRVTVPGYVVRREDEDLIQFAPSATVADPDHPVRPKAPGAEVVAAREEEKGAKHGVAPTDQAEKPTGSKAPGGRQVEQTPTVAPSEGQRAEDAQREPAPGMAPPAGEAKVEPVAEPAAANEPSTQEAPAKQAAEPKSEAPAEQAEAPKPETPPEQVGEPTPEAPAAQATEPKAEAPKAKAPAKQAAEPKSEAPAAQAEEPESHAPSNQTEEPKGARARKPKELTEDPATEPKSKTGSADAKEGEQ